MELHPRLRLKRDLRFLTYPTGRHVRYLPETPDELGVERCKAKKYRRVHAYSCEEEEEGGEVS